MSTSDPAPQSPREERAAAGNGQTPAAITGDGVSDPHREMSRAGESGIVALARRWVESARERLSRAVDRGSAGMLALSLLVGAGAGLGAVAFRYMILGFTYAFTGHRDFSAAGHASNPLLPGLGVWFVVLAPVIAG